MKFASAFSPGHLTGFFQICDEPKKPLMKGSRGAGFSITRGVNTRVMVESAKTSSMTININGRLTREATVSEKVVLKMLSKAGAPLKVHVKHESQIPIGAGFGSSGGGALSLALALNDALRLGLSRIETAKIAHIAEVECKTGLGSVLAELNGGFGVTMKAGGPGIGKTLKFKHEDLCAVCLPFGPIQTREALSNPFVRNKINELGGQFVDELLLDQSRDLFMELSRKFAENIGLFTSRLKAVLKKTDEAKILCSMTMFGETVFSLVEKKQVEKLVSIFRKFSPPGKVIVAGIDDKGARIQDNVQIKSNHNGSK